jgi:purine/pyrimidine-nucleoside phosphorylase
MEDRFMNVTVVKQANVYFDGRVTSRTILFSDGTRKTLGFMLPGEYEFGTAAPEVMEIMAGEMEILLPGEKDWRHISPGASFSVPANSKFNLRLKVPVDYCCSYG